MHKLLLQFIWCFYVRWFLRIIVGVRFENREALKKENQFVILANHNSHLDTASILASLPSEIIHKVKPVTAGDYFGRNKLSSIFSSIFLNTLLIKRTVDSKNDAASPINQMIKAIDEGNSLILFPEGTRGKPEELQPFKRGIALVLAKRSHVKYIPTFMTGMGKSLPKGEKVLVPYNCVLTYGEPTSIVETDSKMIIKEIEAEILKLRKLN